MENLLIMLSLLTLVSCSLPSPKNGDLVFVVGSESEMSEAITDATSGEADALSFDHVGIVAVDGDGKVSVIEALPKKGVTETPFEKFLSSAPKLNGKPGVSLRRLNVDCDLDAAVERARRLVGRPYDWAYDQSNEAIYCSELVWYSFIDNDGEALFDASPINFKGSDGTYPDFWIELFAEMGQPILQGEAGTNPNHMAQESILTEVCRYY